jgi:hypothetical protein
MMFDLNSKQLRLWFAAGALGLGAMIFSTPSGAQRFGGSHGGGGGFHAGGGGFHGGGGGFHGGMGGFHGGMGGFHGGVGGFHGTVGGFNGGVGAFHGGVAGFHGGGVVRGLGGFHGPIGFAHPGSPFGAGRAFVNRPFFSQRRFADRSFFFHRRRFAGPFVTGFYDRAYDYPYYYDDGAYADECFWVRRRFVNRWGYVVVRRKLVCD